MLNPSQLYHEPYHSCGVLLISIYHYPMPNIRIRASRGQDISEFLPHPDVILMADLIYYEEVSVCMSIRVPFVI